MQATVNLPGLILGAFLGVSVLSFLFARLLRIGKSVWLIPTSLVVELLAAILATSSVMKNVEKVGNGELLDPMQIFGFAAASGFVGGSLLGVLAGSAYYFVNFKKRGRPTRKP